MPVSMNQLLPTVVDIKKALTAFCVSDFLEI